jgi:hypothetical protein
VPHRRISRQVPPLHAASGCRPYRGPPGQGEARAAPARGRKSGSSRGDAARASPSDALSREISGTNRNTSRPCGPSFALRLAGSAGAADRHEPGLRRRRRTRSLTDSPLSQRAPRAADTAEGIQRGGSSRRSAKCRCGQSDRRAGSGRGRAKAGIACATSTYERGTCPPRPPAAGTGVTDGELPRHRRSPENDPA